VLPRRATLLNTRKPVAYAVDLVPSDHVEHRAYLRLRNLPVNELSNTVLVVKLEFERLPERFGDGAPVPNTVPIELR
jgi:alpha-L-fucosidase